MVTMAEDKEKKKRFAEEIAELKRKAEEIQQKIKQIEQKKEGNEAVNKICVASYYADLVSIYCAMTELSLNILGYKNESYLDQGRKSLYKAIILLEGIVSNVIDMPLGENSELLKSLEEISDKEKLKFIKKLGYTISLLQDRYGPNSKWKWSFVELEGRYAVVAKNLFDFRAYQAKNDPAVEGFDERYDYLLLVKDLLIKASNRYREKYELTNHNIDDMKKAIEFLRVLKRIYILFNEKDEMQNISKRIEMWSQKLEADMKAKEKMMKMRAARSIGNKLPGNKLPGNKLPGNKKKKLK